MHSSISEFLIILFLGEFGVHKFVQGNIKMGLLYLFTFGLFGIGWIYDIIKCIINLAAGENQKSKSLMSTDDLNLITTGRLPNIQNSGLNLAKDENCCYMDRAYTFKDKTVTAGYTGQGGGLSFRITKGITYKTGGHTSKVIRENERTTYNGVLFITTKRIIFTSQGDGFDKPIDKITSIQEAKDGLLIQIRSKSYSIVTNTHHEFMEVLDLVKNME